jgi:hypothetical protein
MILRADKRVSLITAVVCFSAFGCTIDRQLHTSPGLDGVSQKDSPYLKAHFKNGDVIVLHDWAIDVENGVVSGHGEWKDMHRRPVAAGQIKFPIDRVALFETNRVATAVGPVVALTVVTLLSAALTAACVANPKACFGSCPTFYISDGNKDYLAAEGFSESVAPSLEATDIDALWRAGIKGRTVQLRVTNEALETHTIKQANLLVAPRPDHGRVVHAIDGRFLEAQEFRAPTACPMGTTWPHAKTSTYYSTIVTPPATTKASSSKPGRDSSRLTFSTRPWPTWDTRLATTWPPWSEAMEASALTLETFTIFWVASTCRSAINAGLGKRSAPTPKPVPSPAKCRSCRSPRALLHRRSA